MTEGISPVDPYIQAQQSLNGLLQTDAYERQQLVDSLQNVSNVAPIAGKSIKTLRPVYETLYGYAEELKDRAALNHDRVGIRWFEGMKKAYQSALKLIDNPNVI